MTKTTKAAEVEAGRSLEERLNRQGVPISSLTDIDMDQARQVCDWLNRVAVVVVFHTDGAYTCVKGSVAAIQCTGGDGIVAFRAATDFQPEILATGVNLAGRGELIGDKRTAFARKLVYSSMGYNVPDL